MNAFFGKEFSDTCFVLCILSFGLDVRDGNALEAIEVFDVIKLIVRLFGFQELLAIFTGYFQRIGSSDVTDDIDVFSGE
jgi:hypothetical protein